MKKALTRIESKIWHFVNGEKVIGAHANLSGYVSSGLRGDVSGLSGDVSGLNGDVSGLSGDVSGLSGYVSDLSGYVSGLSGCVSGLSGDIDACDISDEERQKGVSVSELVKTA